MTAKEISQQTFNTASTIMSLIADVNDQIKAAGTLAEKKALLEVVRHLVIARRHLLGVEV